MNLKFITLTHATRSGGSYKATIPIEIVRDLWNKGDESSLTVCFFKDEEGKIVIIPLENVMKDFPKEIRERVVEDWKKKALKGFPRRKFEELTKKLAEGSISERQFLKEMERLFEGLTSKIRKDIVHIKGSLRFADEIIDFLISSVISEERELNEVVEGVKFLVSKRGELAKLLESLQNANIDKNLKKTISYWLSARIESIDEKILQIRSILND